ncbi:VOC family protein [Rhodobacter sp. Har01]|uniref:VOC family protein n=1 Tax=Rhodobacter sp. Har01 TaxID=2883999 RepID=UPI001D072F69|nr:VOC family protein [Rhodobacter sp. Har01]MCB6179411.1 VOC family protein [Rhodobacter sp. Har01]
MQTTSVYPVLSSADVAAAAALFTTHFGFVRLFTADWYVHLQSAHDPAVNLAILAAGHPTIPAAARSATATGVLLNFEVEDVDAEWHRLRTAGLPILLPLRDEPFGQRHFILQGPDGVLIDIIRPIPADAAFAAQYAPEARPA